MRIFQLLSTIAYGDAVSNDTVAMKRQSSRWDIRQEYMPKA